MNINFELYKVFYEVANEKSISKGADKLLISQPAVTQSIKTLESELGGQLFIRTPKGVVLTEEGKILYNLMQQDMVALRVTFRIGFALPNPATALNGDEETRYPFALVKTTA